MKPAALLLLAALSLSSCRKSGDEVAVEETRPLSTMDESPKLNATSSERFLPPDLQQQMPEMPEAEGNWSYDLPAGWRDAGPRMMREINLAFGEGGEAYVSLSGGTLQDNVDRWYGQFGAEPQAVETLPRIEMLGGEAIVIEAQGTYSPGMGRPAKEGQALLGAMIVKDGRIATLKLTGPADEVASQREAFLQFAASLKQGE
ncbi:MAG: hypothetical protein Q7Q71_04460 [Verrucomicrobiota bacterium JB023]|nr:hypothetical protein [Verrucomicrobiota bacterium JB023]